MKRRWIAVAGAIALGAAAGAPGAGFAVGTPDYPQLFGTREIRSSNLALFPKWTGVIERIRVEIDPANDPCTSGFFTRCRTEEWLEYLDGLRGADPMDQLTWVNRYMNRAPYITDPRNYNVPDYWATPRQFFKRDGDCEDYAIAKFVSLRALGWGNDHMRIVVLRDLNLNIAHAVLVVYRDGRAWVLDNQVKRVVAADQIRHYRPYYSLNEDSWWLHRS